MMDNFSEQLVKRQRTSSDNAKRAVVIFGGIAVTILLIAVSVAFMGSMLAILGILLAIAAVYLIVSTIQSMDVEYEYTFTNGELDVDKIIAKRKRTELITAEVRKFTAFGRYSDDLPETEDMTVVLTSDNIASHEYYADFIHEEYGQTRLVFSPDERMLENINKFLPAKLKSMQ